MKILFFARHFTYLRNFESALRLLAERGHTVHVAVQQEEELGGRGMIEGLERRYPTISSGFSPKRKDDWFKVATRLRLGLDYLRYLGPEYAQAPRLESRARERAPRFVVSLTRKVMRGEMGRRRLARWLWSMEQSAPLGEGILRFLREQAPDVVLITPLVGVVASPELDYLYAAKSLGIPTALCVWSWDHLSSKALIRVMPDRVIVWNPTQAREAHTLHQVPLDRIAVTGAQCFDQWFDRQPSRSREAFCARVGLRDSGPFLLWVCSALFRGGALEAEFVVRWIRAIRESRHPELRNVNLLIRPHPQRLTEWTQIDVRQEPGVALWGSNPVDAEPRADYFDSLHYSTAVVGLNTSAFIEGAIAGRPAYTVLPPEYYDSQEGTIHFHYLLQDLLRSARTLDEHTDHLAAALRGEVPEPDRSRRFVEMFVRPQGLGQPSTPLFVEAIESLPSVPVVPMPDVRTWWSRVGLDLLRRAARTEVGRQWIADPRELGGRKASKDEKRRRAAALQSMGQGR